MTITDTTPVDPVCRTARLQLTLQLPQIFGFRHRAQGSPSTLLSIFAHGVTAIPGIGLYGRRVASLDAAAPEHRELRT